MGIFDKAKDVIGQHSDKVEEGIAKISDLADEKTGHQHSDRIDQGEKLAQERVADLGGPSDPHPA